MKASAPRRDVASSSFQRLSHRRRQPLEDISDARRGLSGRLGDEHSLEAFEQRFGRYSHNLATTTS